MYSVVHPSLCQMIPIVHSWILKSNNLSMSKLYCYCRLTNHRLYVRKVMFVSLQITGLLLGIYSSCLPLCDGFVPSEKVNLTFNSCSQFWSLSFSFLNETLLWDSCLLIIPGSFPDTLDKKWNDFKDVIFDFWSHIICGYNLVDVTIKLTVQPKSNNVTGNWWQQHHRTEWKLTGSLLTSC